MAKIIRPEHIEEFEHFHMITEEEEYDFAENAALAFKGYPLFEWTFNNKYDVDVMKETFKLVVNEDLSNDAKTIKVPTVIVWGEKDNETKLYMAKKLNRLIIGSSLKIIKDAGHFSFIDKPQEFLIILDTFLKNL